MHFLPENIGFATFLKCACSSALFVARPDWDKWGHMETNDAICIVPPLQRKYGSSNPTWSRTALKIERHFYWSETLQTTRQEAGASVYFLALIVYTFTQAGRRIGIITT